MIHSMKMLTTLSLLSLAVACGGSQNDETASAPGESAAAVPASAQSEGATAPVP